jgi:hypothetical protein
VFQNDHGKERALKRQKSVGKQSTGPGMSRRLFCRALAGVSLVVGWGRLAAFASAEQVPPEPEDLDVPTPWQEGDPEPVKMTILAEEPEQTSIEAPPSRPMDDERPEQPSPDHAWVTGYWVTPPHAGYVYVSGYWRHKDDQWVFVRGGWAKPNTTAVVAFPGPRPVLTALVITAPRRIVRRHYGWGYYPARRVQRRVDRRIDRRQDRRKERRHGG